MAHPMVEQLRFARSEFQRCLAGITAEEATQRLGRMNSLSWMVGHLANQEQGYWVWLAGADMVVPDLNNLVGFGKPASTPPLDDMQTAWQAITQQADLYLDTLTTEDLQTFFMRNGKPVGESKGTMLYRTIYHYWFHTGEAHAIRQQMNHELPEFVGRFGETAVYQPH